MRRFQCLPERLRARGDDKAINQAVVIPVDIHLSHASRCAEQLIEIIRCYNPDTFPLMALSKVRGIVLYYYHS